MAKLERVRWVAHLLCHVRVEDDRGRKERSCLDCESGGENTPASRNSSLTLCFVASQMYSTISPWSPVPLITKCIEKRHPSKSKMDDGFILRTDIACLCKVYNTHNICILYTYCREVRVRFLE